MHQTLYLDLLIEQSIEIPTHGFEYFFPRTHTHTHAYLLCTFITCIQSLIAISKSSWDTLYILASIDQCMCVLYTNRLNTGSSEICAGITHIMLLGHTTVSTIEKLSADQLHHLFIALVTNMLLLLLFCIHAIYTVMAKSSRVSPRPPDGPSYLEHAER